MSMPSSDLPKARQQHYVFAHAALPQLAHASPPRMMNVLCGPTGRDFLRRLWEEVGNGCDADERVPGEGISLDVVQLPTGHVAGVISLPEPRAVPEAYFVAVVAPEPDESGFAADTGCRVITLEKTMDLLGQGGPLTVIGEWTADGAHANFGSGPAPALADFVAPVGSGVADFIGAFAVTAGHGINEWLRKYEADHDPYNSIMVKALADRLAEAFAEFLHKRVRDEWGYGKAETLANEDFIKEKYRGIRPAAGYPACPDHTEKQILWDLLKVKESAGMELTESCAMMPAASVSGLYFAHPEAKYFNVGLIGRDQVEVYAKRKRMPMGEVENWLSPNLGY